MVAASADAARRKIDSQLLFAFFMVDLVSITKVRNLNTHQGYA